MQPQPCPMIEIANSGRLTQVFGHWPDFHDAEVLALRLSVAAREQGNQATIEADFDVAEPSDEVDQQGSFKVRVQCRVTLRFENVAALRLTDFSYQNVLEELSLAAAAPEDRDENLGPLGRRRYRVTFLGIVGCDLTFLCDSVHVLAVTPVVAAA